MTTQSQAPARLASEDVIINAPLSYAGSAQRIMRMRRKAPGGGQLAAMTMLAILLVVLAWTFVTAWYLTWGLLLVPYRLLRRGARKRKVEALRHRELMGTIQGSAAASAGAIVTATTPTYVGGQPEVPIVLSPNDLISDADRERASDGLREDLLAGRLTPEEFEERIGAVHTARTRSDINAVRVDLPSRPAVF